MPKSKSRVPAYRRQRGSPHDRAFVELGGTRHYLGVFGSPESKAAYGRRIAEWQSGGRQPLERPDTLTVEELCDRFMRHAEGYYKQPDGTVSTEVDAFTMALRPLLALYRETAARDFGPLAFKAVRNRIMEHGCGKPDTPKRLGCNRGNTNKLANRVRHVFKWAVAEELLPASVYQALAAVPGLKRGRCEAREGEPVTPVPQEHIDAIKPHVSKQVWALVQLQLLTGARAGELVTLRSVDLNTSSGRVWTAEPKEHKTAWHGHRRTVYVGPKAQDIIRPFLAGRAVDAFLFSPREAEADRRAAMHAERVTPESCGNGIGTNRRRNPKRPPGDCYDVGSYRRAIQRGCEAAGVPGWHPHRLRHNSATELRRQFGLDAAATILGHRSPSITSIYAEADQRKAVEVIERVG